jgi:hypothetical protein
MFYTCATRFGKKNLKKIVKLFKTKQGLRSVRLESGWANGKAQANARALFSSFKNQKFFKIFCHIKFYGICMEH